MATQTWITALAAIGVLGVASGCSSTDTATGSVENAQENQSTVGVTLTLTNNLGEDAILGYGWQGRTEIIGAQVTPVGMNFGDTVKAGDSVTLQMDFPLGQFFGKTGFLPPTYVPLTLNDPDPQDQESWYSAFSVYSPGVEALAMNSGWEGFADKQDADQSLSLSLDEQTLQLNVNAVTCSITKTPTANDCVAATPSASPAAS